MKVGNEQHVFLRSSLPNGNGVAVPVALQVIVDVVLQRHCEKAIPVVCHVLLPRNVKVNPLLWCYMLQCRAACGAKRLAFSSYYPSRFVVFPVAVYVVLRVVHKN